jgi:hypothetical protein
MKLTPSAGMDANCAQVMVDMSTGSALAAETDMADASAAMDMDAFDPIANPPGRHLLVAGPS